MAAFDCGPNDLYSALLKDKGHEGPQFMLKLANVILKLNIIVLV